MREQDRGPGKTGSHPIGGDMAKMGKMGNTFDSSLLKSPLTVGAPKNEPGPDVNNNPVARPGDPLGLIPEGGKKGR